MSDDPSSEWHTLEGADYETWFKAVVLTWRPLELPAIPATHGQITFGKSN